MLPLIRAAFFDVDGVIVMSEPLHQKKIIEVARDPLGYGYDDTEYGVKINPETQWNQELAGIGDHRIYEWIVDKNAHFPLSEEIFVEKCAQYYLDHANELTVRTGVVDAIDYLYESGVPIGIVSSGVRPQVDRNLECAGIIEKVSFTISADDIPAGKTKPDPYPYILALQKANQLQPVGRSEIAPHDCIVIEDSGSGVKSAASANIPCIHWVIDDSSAFHPNAAYQLGANEELAIIIKLLNETHHRDNGYKLPDVDITGWRSRTQNKTSDYRPNGPM